MLSPAPHILFLTYGMFTGGAETMLVNLINRLDRTRVQPILFTLATPGEMERVLDPAIPLIRAVRRSKYDRHPAEELLRVIEERKIGAVLTLGLFSYLFLRRALKAHPGTKVLISLHTTRPRTLKEFLQTFAYARTLRPSDTLVTVCNSQAEYLSRHYAIPRGRFCTVYNGVDTGRWSPAPASFRREEFLKKWDVAPGTPVIVQVAQFRAEKRQEDSVRALALLHGAKEPAGGTAGASTPPMPAVAPDVKPVILFVGGGDAGLRERVRATAESLGMTPYVRFCGQHADPREFYWAADLFTLSSNSETLPMTLLEALATGLPAVTTDVGGAREIVEEGVDGAIARPEDPSSLASAWRRVLGRREQFNRQLISARAAGRFSLDRCVQEYERLLTGRCDG